MARLEDLIKDIPDQGLRDRISEEVNKLKKSTSFGLLFESHQAECTPLYGMPIKVGATVALKNGDINDIYVVVKIDGNTAECQHKSTREHVTFNMDEIVIVASFTNPIYPYLQPITCVCNAPRSDLWHILIEADNYHALQLLEYLYAGKVDCIYIDPPYNTGAKDWKYNNNFVDSNDNYRHSKWLSMMEKRLELAKTLLNPDDSVLIVTIDEKEYLQLGCLLEKIFPEANIQMISSVINPSGTKRLNEFSRSDEYIFFVMLGISAPMPISTGTEETDISWETFRRHDLQSRRGTTKGGTSQFYPIYVNDTSKKIEKIGDPIGPDVDISTVPQIKGCTAVFPIRDNGTEMNWGTRPETARVLLENGYIKVAKYTPEAPQKYSIQYLTSGRISDILDGRAIFQGYAEDGSVIVKYKEQKRVMPKTNWNFKQHNANAQGSRILDDIFDEKRFNFPKSLYAVYDTINLFVAEKPDALIVDFFAGSGTTLHAVNLLNAGDNGHRRCIMVTNNEVSDEEAKFLSNEGYHPGDEEWEERGIARYVTWPRTFCSIMGHDVYRRPLSGDYGIKIETYKKIDEKDDKVLIVSTKTKKPIRSTVYKKIQIEIYPNLAEIKRSDGFKANAIYFKLGFLDKNSVALGRQFAELLPMLWMKAGAIGECPIISPGEIRPQLIFSDNKFAVLVEETAYVQFVKDLKNYPDIRIIYIITDSEDGYQSMIREFKGKETYQLYKDYLENFRLNIRR